MRLLSPSCVAQDPLHGLTTSLNTLSPHGPSSYISPALTPPASLPNLLRSFTCTNNRKDHLPSHEKNKKRFEKGLSNLRAWRCTMPSSELCERVQKTGIKTPPSWSTTPHIPTPRLPPPISSITSATELDRAPAYSQEALTGSDQRCQGHCCQPSIYYITSHSTSRACPFGCSLTLSNCGGGISQQENQPCYHPRSIMSNKYLDDIDVQKLATAICPGCSKRVNPGYPKGWTSKYTSYSPNHLTHCIDKCQSNLETVNRSVSTTSLSSILNLYDTCDYLHLNKDSSCPDKSWKKQKQGEDTETWTKSDLRDRNCCGAAAKDGASEGVNLFLNSS